MWVMAMVVKGIVKTGSGGTTVSKELYFNTRLEFPAVGKENMLYIATDEDLIYGFDAETTSYICLSGGDSDINNIKVIQGIL